MIRILLINVALSISVELFAQQNIIQPEVISSAGSTFNSTTLLLDWTLGEVSINTYQKEGIILTQGFHQPRLVITQNKEIARPNESISIFPNPTSDFVNITMNFDEQKSIILNMTDINGKLIWENKYFGNHITDSKMMNDLPNGTYLFNFRDEKNKTHQTFKIQKNF